MIGKRSFLALACGLLVCQWLPAENKQLDTEVVSDTQMDSIAKLYETKLQELVTRRETMDADNNTLLNPRYYRLFGRPTLYSSSVSEALETKEKVALFEAPSAPDYLPLAQDSRLARNESLEKAIDQAVLNASITNPEQFVLTEGRIKEQVKTVSSFLIEIMPVMFVPAAAGLMLSYHLLAPSIAAYAVITIVSTISVMVVSGRVTQRFMHRKSRKEDTSNG